MAALTRSWAAEFSPAGVRVNAVAGLGATKLNEVDKGTAHWATLADPEGNEFDVIAG